MLLWHLRQVELELSDGGVVVGELLRGSPAARYELPCASAVRPIIARLRRCRDRSAPGRFGTGRRWGSPRQRLPDRPRLPMRLRRLGVAARAPSASRRCNGGPAPARPGSGPPRDGRQPASAGSPAPDRRRPVPRRLGRSRQGVCPTSRRLSPTSACTLVVRTSLPGQGFAVGQDPPVRRQRGLLAADLGRQLGHLEVGLRQRPPRRQVRLVGPAAPRACRRSRRPTSAAGRAGP